MLLLCASYYFYMCWKAEYAILLFISTYIAYYTGIKMGATDRMAKRKKYFLFSIFSNLGILFIFKYFNFFTSSVNYVFRQFNIFYDSVALNFLLPIGISFYTFQALSYSIDVYKGEKKPEQHFGIFALYVSFFPQLVSGPIERSTKLLPQFHKKQSLDYNKLKQGALLILWGFFKKIVIADRIAITVNQVYGNPSEQTSIMLLVAILIFPFQVYCDFSGYSDIAVGSAKVMGIDLMSNFNFPFMSKSVSEFWRRWHISLSTWLNDYLYTPIVINRRYWGKFGIIFAILITFILCGLWHGASWNFVLFGFFHGFIIALEVITKKFRKSFFKNISKPFYNAMCMILTFLFFSFSLIFFRANTFNDTLIVLSKVFSFDSFDKSILLSNFKSLFNVQIMISISLLVIMESIHYFKRQKNLLAWISSKPVFIRWGFYYTMIFSIIFLGEFKSEQFIYFQF